MSGHYEVLDVLGGGAFATVAVVRTPSGQRRAVKLLREHREGEVDAVSRFRDEARILQQLDHPHIVKGYGLRQWDGHLAMELEFVDGVALDRVLSSGGPRRLSPLQATELVGQAAEALWAAWAEPMGGGPALRIVHRDVRPGNLILDRKGQIRVLDFGLAHGAFDGREAVSLYDVGGSIGFIAPERKDGEQGGPEVDVFALGVLLVLLMSGQQMLLPHREERHREVALKHVHDLPIDPGVLRDLIASMLAYAPADRPGMDEVVATLRDQRPEGGMRLADLSEEWIQRVRSSSSGRDARHHPRFTEVRILERGEWVGQSTEPAPVARRKLTALLADPSWIDNSARVAELRRAADPPIDGPLLALLDRVDPPWWRVFARPTSPREAETLLHILGDRPSASAVVRARRLAGHADGRVRKAAELVIDRGER